jgi:hypothetical protein
VSCQLGMPRRCALRGTTWNQTSCLCPATAFPARNLIGRVLVCDIARLDVPWCFVGLNSDNEREIADLSISCSLLRSLSARTSDAASLHQLIIYILWY